MPDASPADQVRQFAEWLAGTDIAELELRTAQGAIVVRQNPADMPPAGTSDGTKEAAAPPATHAVASPSLGVFLHRHPLHDADLVQVGQAVREGEIVGFLRIGALLLPLAAPRDGVIVEIAVPHGDIAGYGAVLLRIRPHAG